MKKHPSDRMKNKEEQISKEILNKTLLFDTKKIDEEIIMDKIIETL